MYTPIVALWVFLLQFLLTPWYLLFLEVGRGGIFARLQAERRTLIVEVCLALVFAVLWDVWQYWIHRWQHVSTLLWETHKFHHSDAALNASSQARHHALSYVLYLVTYAPMLLLFGTFAPHAAVSIIMFRLWGFVNHANVRVPFGLLTTLIAGPQWHRIHHSIQEEHFDRNFAALFPFIDRVFGTYYAPARDEYPPTGLPFQEERMLRQATISPLVAWSSAILKTVRGRWREPAA